MKLITSFCISILLLLTGIPANSQAKNSAEWWLTNADKSVLPEK